MLPANFENHRLLGNEHCYSYSLNPSFPILFSINACTSGSFNNVVIISLDLFIFSSKEITDFIIDEYGNRGNTLDSRYLTMSRRMLYDEGYTKGSYVDFCSDYSSVAPGLKHPLDRVKLMGEKEFIRNSRAGA